MVLFRKLFILYVLAFAMTTSVIPSHGAVTSETPTETPTVVPNLPDLLHITLDSNHELKRLVRDTSSEVCLAAQAETGDLYCMDRARKNWIEIHKISPFLSDQVRQEMKSGLIRSFDLKATRSLIDLAVDSDETIYAMTRYESIDDDMDRVLIMKPDISRIREYSFGYTHGILIVDNGALIAGVNPPDVLLIKNYHENDQVLQYDPYGNRPITALIRSEQINNSPIRDFIIGRENLLNLLVQGKNQSTKIYLFKEDDVVELTRGGILPGYIPHQFAYLAMEQSFYIAAENTENKHVLFRVSKDGLSVEKVGDIGAVFSMVSTKDGRNLYFTNPLSENISAIYALTYTGPGVTPTPSFTPTITPTPSCTPTNTLTPSNTPTVTPTPTFGPVQWSEDRYETDILVHHTGENIFLAIHPVSGNLVFQRDWYSRSPYSLSPSEGPYDLHSVEPSFYISKPVNFLLHAIHPDGRMYGIKDNYAYSKINVQRLTQTGFLDYVYDSLEAKFQAMHIVSETDNIPGTVKGDVLILGEKKRHKTGIWKIHHGESPTQVPEVEPLLPDEDLPIYPLDWTIGPGGSLYLLTYDSIVSYRCKIHRLDMDNKFREVFHFSLGETYMGITYFPADHAFFFPMVPHSNYNSITRISEDGSQISEMLYSNGRIYDLVTSLDGMALYLLFRHSYISERNCIQVLRYKGDIHTPTPTPSMPTPAPTPIPGWFVLDGYGGIHMSNPETGRPLLPYFAPYDIARDIEPDPLGRGWYMLDGLGVVHTSSPDLPRPVGLPYFGFDIARNLEVVSTENGLEFYMLDGHGVVHTSTGKPFDYGYLPWLGEDLARDLEPDPKSEGWLILDGYGAIHFSHRRLYDYPLEAPFDSNPLARGMVRFPDETTVIIDGFGGRHTNPFWPAVDVVDGLSPEFYFWGFDIIWDIETVPAAQQ